MLSNKLLMLFRKKKWYVENKISDLSKLVTDAAFNTEIDEPEKNT